jgi:hypothetical protein
MARKRGSAKRAKLNVSSQLATANEDDVCVFSLTQGDKPLCCLALANHALQGYCVNAQLVCHIDSEFMSGISDSGADVWDSEQGYEIMSVMSALCCILKFEQAPMDNPFLGASMLVKPDEGDNGIPKLITDGWKYEETAVQENKKEFDLYTVTVKVKQDNVDLTHMFVLKAFSTMEEANPKKWVVLDVVPGFLPFIVGDINEFLSSKIHLSHHLLDAFDEVDPEVVKVYGVKGHYAHRNFHLQSHTEVGLPYNLADVPASVPFVYRVYKLSDLVPMQIANPVALDL